MLWPIMQHMTALAERLQVPRPVVGRIMIEMGCRQHDLRYPDSNCAFNRAQAGQGTTAAVSPGLGFLIPPAPIAKMFDLKTMRPATALTTPFGALKSDHR